MNNVTSKFIINSNPCNCIVNIAPNGCVSKYAKIIAIICVTVFIFPHLFAAITVPFFSTAISLYPDTANSLVIIIIGIHAGSIPFSTNISIADITIILSAIGSRNFPKVVT